MPKKFLRLVQVQQRVPFSRSNLYLLMEKGAFPKACNLGARAVAWLESDIDEWIESRIATGRSVASVTSRSGAAGRNRAEVRKPALNGNGGAGIRVPEEGL